jgi:hypothetical protein
MKSRAAGLAVAILTRVYAAQIPAGAELSIRLTDKVASEAPCHSRRSTRWRSLP